MRTRPALVGTAAILVAAAVAYLVGRAPPAASPAIPEVERQAADAAEGAELVSTAGGPGTEAGRRSPVPDGPPGGVAATAGTNVLRVIVAGLAEEEARRTTVTVRWVDESSGWPPAEVRDAWPSQGTTSELVLDPFLARVAEQGDDPGVDELLVEVDHALHFVERARVPLSAGVPRRDGRTVHEVRMRFVPPVYWPEFTLSVRDARTLAHLEDVELRCVTTAWMGLAGHPGTGEPYTSLGDDLSSPIALLGGREADEPEGLVAGLAFRPAAGEATRPIELSTAGRVRPGRGIVTYARAPGYAWGRIILDVSTGAERELLLQPAAALDLTLTNVQLERYAALEQVATLRVEQRDPRGGSATIWTRRLDQSLEDDGLWLESLEPGELAVSVELGAAGWRESQELAREELSLDAGETRELVLALPDAPAPPARANLGGVISFPTPSATWGEQNVRLQLYGSDFRHGDADIEIPLAELSRVGGTLPSWSFRLEDLAVGRYQVQLWPLMKSWTIELPAGGAEDVELVLDELAEVLVETVDARTGERLPVEELRHGHPERLPGQTSDHEVAIAFEDEPGRFRFRAAPGPAHVRTYRLPDDFDHGGRRLDLELVPGLQSVRLELAPVHAIRFEFHEDGAALPYEDAVYYDVLSCVGAVEHDGRVRPIAAGYVSVTAPGLYEISFEGVGVDRFQPIPPRRVDVREGETSEVIVELERK